jgi:sugar phosphate isomerase/epimerase
MTHAIDRRRFLQQSACIAAASGLTGLAAKSQAQEKQPLFQISLAQWSLHKALRAKMLDNLDFAKVAKQDCGIEAIEYVNQFFKDKANDQQYLGEMKKRAADLGVKILLIMIDGEGRLGALRLADRLKTVENHYRWVEAANFLGCHSIRVNAQSEGSYEDQLSRAADGLRALTEFGDKHDINIIVENHGGLSSNGEWLTSVIKKVDHKRCGTLPDFGNFGIDRNTEYDRYKGVTELMPFAKGVSAKSYDFNEQGEETKIDYLRMMKIVLAAGYRGFVGIEYEGSRLGEMEGILATKKLLEKVRRELST